uniref:Fibronectin type-III domain-containing protein n=1 Tax=Macrostomum lignano TaxID=282301 RepID=A0A1I8FLE3_9PLAT
MFQILCLCAVVGVAIVLSISLPATVYVWRRTASPRLEFSGSTEQPQTGDQLTYLWSLTAAERDPNTVYYYERTGASGSPPSVEETDAEYGETVLRGADGSGSCRILRAVKVICKFEFHCSDSALEKPKLHIREHWLTEPAIYRLIACFPGSVYKTGNACQTLSSDIKEIF